MKLFADPELSARIITDSICTSELRKKQVLVFRGIDADWKKSEREPGFLEVSLHRVLDCSEEGSYMITNLPVEFWNRLEDIHTIEIDMNTKEMRIDYEDEEDKNG